MTYLRAWIDDARVGCGWRFFVDISGPRAKTRRLFYIPRLLAVSVASLPRGAEIEQPLSPTERRALRVKLRARVKEAKARGERVPAAQVRAAMEALS